MESENRLPLVLRILLPFIFVLLAPISPLAESAREAWTSARQAAREEISLPAAQGFSRAAQMYPWRSDLWEQAAVWQMNAGSTERAEASFANAEQAGGLSAQGRLARADLWVQMGRIDEGREQYLRLGSAAGQAESIYADTAARLLEAGNLDGYARVLETWQASHPRSADALFAWGQWLVVRRPEAAVRPLLQAASLRPALAGDVAELQSALAELEDTQDAAYRLALQGQALGRVGSWTLAQVCFDQAVQAAPEYAEAWALLGEARQQTGQDGIAELERALQLNPQSQIALALTAQYWRRQNKPQEALAVLSDLRRLYPQQAVWFAETGSALAASGDLINAFAYYQQAVEVEPENALTWRVLAAFSVEYGVDVRTVGLPAARRAVALAPEDAQAQDVLGWTLLNLGDRITAERILQRAAALDGSSRLIRYHLGQLYFLRGLPETAERYLRAVVNDSAPNDPLRDAALRLLRRMGRE